jgi:hypothetical protein
MYLVSACFQGRVPAWNLAGLLQPDPTSPGPGATSGPGLAHPLPHYSGAYGSQHPSAHYSHLLPQASEAAGHQWPPPTMEAEGLHYKMDPDASAMTAMYYPHQVSYYMYTFL